MRKFRRGMRFSTLLFAAFAVVLVLGVSTRARLDARPKPSAKKPVKLLGGILLPGNPLRFDIGWVDQATGSHSVAAYRENNHIFVPIAIPTNAAPTDVCNTMFGLPEKRGCIAVYAHEN